MPRILALLLTLVCLLLALSGCALQERLVHTVTKTVADQMSVDPPPADYVSQEISFRYTKSFLSPEAQYLYDQLLAGLMAQEEVIEDLYPDNDMIQEAIHAIDRDYPELFWFAGNGRIETTMLGDFPTKADYRPTYTMDPQQRASAQAAIDQWEAACFATLPPEASDYQKVLGVYRYIIDHADYQVVENNSIANIMVDGRGLCGCYAKTTQYLLGRLGVDCAYISGVANQENHAWNLVWVEGVPCWVDTTWGDPVFEGGDPSDGPAYEYLCIPTADLQRNHSIDDTVPVPDCVDDRFTYFRQSGLYYEYYDPDALVEAFKNALSTGEERVCVRFSDEAYPGAIDTLFVKGEVHSLLRQANWDLGLWPSLGSSLWYSKNDEMCAVSIHLPE